MENLRGLLERIVFFNEDNDYFVGEILPEDSKEKVMIQGKLANPMCGETVEISGHWTTSKYGRQFKFETYKQVLPSSIYGIRKFLSSGIVKGVGEKFAERIVDYFGVTIFKVLDEESGRLREIKGLGKAKALALKDAWVQYRGLREAHIYLHSLGLSTGQCQKLIKRFGSSVRHLVQETPYALIGEVDRIGFKTIDQIARNAGISIQDPARLRAGLEFAMSTSEDYGNTACKREELLKNASKLLDVDPQDLEHPLIDLIERELIEVVTEGNLLQSPRMARHERIIAKNIMRLKAGESTLPPIDFDKAVIWAQQRNKIELTPEQIRGIGQGIKEKVSILTGGPGTGKTTVLRTLIEILRAKKVIYHLASPTGRAAQRMTEATGAPAQTIHRLLGYNAEERRWMHNEEEPIETQFLIVDESSMIDTALMSALLRALPDKAHLILVGDADQLPSVGPGEILHNLISSKIFSVTRLGRIFRQNEGLLLTTAYNILQGERNPPLYKKQLDEIDAQVDLNAFSALTPETAADAVVELCKNVIPNKLGYDPVNDMQVLVPMHKGEAGTINLNERLQKALNPGRPSLIIGNTRYSIGDKIIQTRNNYNLGLFNGDIGTIESFSALEGKATVNFSAQRVEMSKQDLNDTSLAYAISIHKSQGSEYPCVMVVLLRSHYAMLNRNLLYTALTRGKRQVIVLGDPSAYKIAAARVQTSTRTTALNVYLADANAQADELPM